MPAPRANLLLISVGRMVCNRPRSPHPTLQQCTQWRTADDSLVLGEDLVTWRGYVDEQTVAEWFLGSLGFDLVSKNYWADRPQREHTYYWREWDYLAQVEANHFCGGFCEPGPSLFVDYDLSGRQGPTRTSACRNCTVLF
ncbi:unnamed protein product [Prorocentrum cordatum]|uniref:Uncharacterized protein n=1 Tax=Prorocentrum cordatum TaxID=2364126 RepID=A0ABN9V9J8_9DINO|nr:unnamed protein product [Polarella glacialis]